MVSHVTQSQGQPQNDCHRRGRSESSIDRSVSRNKDGRGEGVKCTSVGVEVSTVGLDPSLIAVHIMRREDVLMVCCYGADDMLPQLTLSAS